MPSAAQAGSKLAGGELQDTSLMSALKKALLGDSASPAQADTSIQSPLGNNSSESASPSKVPPFTFANVIPQALQAGAGDPVSDLGKPPSFPSFEGATQSIADAISGIGSKGKKMSFEEVVTTMGRHEDLFKKAKGSEDLEKIRDDPNTPTDAKDAIDTLLHNREMFKLFDGAEKGGHTDGKISSSDIRKLQDLPEVKQFAEAKASTYTHNYMPSDAKPGSPPREMTANDAMRELFQYSESLPKKGISMDTMRKIADGSQDMGKCPPQVAAAAKFFVDHPGQWQALTKDDGGKVSRDRLCDLAAQNVNLSPQESKAIDTLRSNKDIFFKGGGLNPDKLKDIANDSKNSKEVREAANLLAQPHSMLFSMLDNGKHGAGGNFFNKANDKKISEGDLSSFIEKGTNKVAPPSTLSGPPQTRGAQEAHRDMDIGQETQPDDKKEKGGGIFKLLDALSWIGTTVATVFTGGAAGALLTAGRIIGTTVGKVVAREAGKEALQQGAKHATRQAAEQEVKDSVKDAGKQVGKDFAKDAAVKLSKDGAEEYAKDYVNDYTSERAERIQGGDTGVEGPRVWAQT